MRSHSRSQHCLHGLHPADTEDWTAVPHTPVSLSRNQLSPARTDLLTSEPLQWFSHTSEGSLCPAHTSAVCTLPW